MSERIFVITEHGVKENCKELQTKEIQAVLDMCKEEGGTVVFPKGEFYAASLRIWSDMTLLFKSGSRLYGSEECDDYEVYEAPEGVELRTDMEMIEQYYISHGKDPKNWHTYRRAMISGYGIKNIKILGEEDSIIDGRNCYDPDGEESYRGPHGIFLTNCENVELRGYTIQHNGNFMHQLDVCTNVLFKNVQCYGGSDATHLHYCKNVLIEDCVFHTGDDCIAGINIRDLVIRNTEINTSCNVSRIGGVNILFDKCRMYGPGDYPHRITIVKSKTECLPITEGRHNMIAVMEYFASTNYPDTEPSRNIVFRDCVIENFEFILGYCADCGSTLQSGCYLKELVFENTKLLNMNRASHIKANKDVPLEIRFKNVEYTFREGAQETKLFGDDCVNLNFVEEN